MQYKQFTLDPFQIDSINAIEKNNSVVVSAATGTGKTLIADYIIDKSIKEGKKVFYTAPIKALSNQKYKDFKEEYGEDKVGIMTGDIVINGSAQIVVMTTEIFRNMLMVEDPIVNDLSYVVFDEIHFINDIERGVVWEESIIFAPDHVRFLCLSATIPNAREFADWIESIKEHRVEVVEYLKRAVPLKHLVFEKMTGLTSAKKLQDSMDLDIYPDYAYVKKRQKKRKKMPLPASHIDVVREIKGEGLPAIFFTFSRKACEIKAKELGRTIDLTSKKEKNEIIKIFNEIVNKDITNLISAQRLRRVLPKGIAFHHAGMIPNLKEIVEALFAKGLIKVLYATETFAVGINMPAKMVCFNTVQKYDGINFRYLNSKEYFQMAGRAGRRGIDKEGTAIVLVNRETDDVKKIIKISSKDVDPIISQFHLTINTVINLIQNYDEETIQEILTKSFDYYLKSKGNKQVRIMASWKNKVKLLKKLGYVNKENRLTKKGGFTRYIYASELLTSEIFTNDLYKDLDLREMILVIMSIMYEPRRGRKFFKIKRTINFADNTYKKVDYNEYIKKNLNINTIRNLAPMVSAWVGGCEFEELLEFTNLEEGDIIRLFHQAIDLLRQIKKASKESSSIRNEELEQKAKDCIELLDRDVIKIEF